MTRDKAFVVAVQTGVLLWASKHAHDPVYVKEAAQVVALASAVPEEAIPFDVAEAAVDYLTWKLFDGKRPEWHAAPSAR